MEKSFFILAISFMILFFTNLVWGIINSYMWITNGIESIIQGTNLLENIYYSQYAGIILLADIVWISSFLVFIFQRRHYKNESLHYLQQTYMEEPKICVIIPTYNESTSIENVIKDYFNQKYIKHILVIDNNSNDNTVAIAEKANAKVIRKNQNKGFSHSFLLGLNEALKIDANVIVTTEADGTYEGKNIEKLLPYLDNCDIVVGSRQTQILTEQGNQNSRLHVWGNFLLAKLIQLKYFNLHHLGIVNLSDVGCPFFVLNRTALEKIIKKLNQCDIEKPIWDVGLHVYLLLLAIENDLRIVEAPVTFKKRIGLSKIGSDKKIKGIKIGLGFLWIILTS